MSVSPSNDTETDRPLAVSFSMSAYQVLKKRSDFLAAARGRRQPMTGMMVQALNRGDDLGIRVGFTCSKKVGNAVARNRAKRRLRAVAREVIPEFGVAGFDYVLIGRETQTAERPYADLVNDLKRALAKIHAGQLSGQLSGQS